SDAIHQRIITSMKGVSELKYGFYTGGWTTNLDTGVITQKKEPDAGVSHLTAMFGLPEICAELVATYCDRVPKFAEMWAQYVIIYGGTDEERTAALGRINTKEFSLISEPSRCMAYAARLHNDRALAERAWHMLYDRSPIVVIPPARTTRI